MGETRKFATGTKIGVDKTLEDLRKKLRGFGADGFANLDRSSGVQIVFDIPGPGGERRTIRFAVALPNREGFRGGKRKVNRYAVVDFERTDAEIDALIDGERMRIYRALKLVIDAKLVAIQEGIQTIDEAFFAETVVNRQGATVFESSNERVTEAYRQGLTGDILPALPPGRTIFRALPDNSE